MGKKCRITIRKNRKSGVYEVNKCGRGIALGKTKAEAIKKAKEFREQIKRKPRKLESTISRKYTDILEKKYGKKIYTKSKSGIRIID